MSEFEFEITRGERLPADTRMELPEMSYEQELLNMPIPFKNRVEILSDYVKPTSRHHTPESLAKALEVTERQAMTLVKEVGPDSTYDEHGMQTFELYTLEVIEEELAWHRDIEKLPDYLPAIVIATHLARGKGWVVEHAYGLGVYPILEKATNGKKTYLYPKEVVTMLRILSLHFPPANDLYSRGETALLLGKSEEWLDAAMHTHGFPVEMRASAIANRVGPHYSQKTLDALRAIAEAIRPAGGWLTEAAICAELQRDYDWVHPRLEKFKHFSEERLTSAGNAHPHYPPEVLEMLRAESNEILPAGDWVTEYAIAALTNRPRSWVKKQLVSHIGESEIRQARVNNAPRRHFPPEVVEALKELEHQEEKSS